VVERDVRSREGFYEYRLDPSDPWERPEKYVGPVDRSELLSELLEPHVSLPRDVLEVGFGAGANLARLYADGFRDLHTVELNPEMVTTFERHYPAVAEATDLRRGPVERELPRMASDGVDATATVAVLAHLHPDSEFVFDQLVRVTADVLVTIENERTRDPLFVPRNYRTVFESRGCEQVAFVGADAIDDRTKLSDNCRARVFDVGRLPDDPPRFFHRYRDSIYCYSCGL